MSFRFKVVLAIMASPAALARAEPNDDKFSYLDNGEIKVGVGLELGGSIGYLADSKNGESVINIHDLGRFVGQSYYSGPKPFGTAHPSWKDWPWNPVSAGDVYGNPAKIVDKKNDGKSIYVKSIPMQWALKNVPGDCQFETWITLKGRTVQIRNRLTNKRKDHTQYPANDQELPGCYTIGKLHRLMTYVGDEPFSDKTLEEIPKVKSKDDKAEWTPFIATEHWAALVDESDWGLGVVNPGVYRFLGGFYGKQFKGGPRDDATGYVAGVRQEILDHDIVYEYEYYLVLDTLTNIRKEAYRLRPKSPLPDYRFKENRRHWWYINAADAGQPIQGHLRVKLENDDPQMIGPEENWPARDAPVVYIRAAYKTSNKFAEIFWETAEKPGFSPEQKVRFEVQPNGEYRTYEVNLSRSPAYRGTIRRLRFDPVESGQAGDHVDIEFISVKKPNDGTPVPPK
jgi:hypothetical protein